MVRLITHNLLACHAKGCTSNNFPLQFEDVQVEVRETDFNSDFIRAFIPKLEWKALVDAAKQVQQTKATPHNQYLTEFPQLGDTSLPSECPEMLDDEFMKNLHHALLEVSAFTTPFK